MQEGSAPNAVFVFNTDMLVPRLRPIFHALDKLEHYPKGWADIVLVLCKPGRPDYTNLAMHHPVVLMKDFPKIYHATETGQHQETKIAI
ncbi:hypothetical protein B0H10DRAFT_1837162 [Mycena sp. CBHHK59/15]|nr:hypothetical protein B0H10DRAFT_1837162 [Mycena sp. CBHHK59/15]